MANDSQREKARAIFGKTFFANTKEPAPAKNAAAALQKRANARPIPTYKVGGVVKKQNGGAMSGRNTPEADDVLITTARGKRMLEEQKRREAEKAKAEAAKRARADKLLGIPAQKGGGKAGCYADGGKAMAGAKRAVKAERDFSGLMMDAAKRAAAKGTPVMKDGGPTDEYTAKRVMSRIKAGNFAEGGEAKDRMEARLRKVENAYKVALAKGKNEGIAKAKFERKKADIADDYAKKTGADRTATKAAEQAAKAALREARQTKGVSMAKREFGESLMQKGSQSVAPKTVDVSATLKGLSAMPKAEAAKPKAAPVKRRVVQQAAPTSTSKSPIADFWLNQYPKVKGNASRIAGVSAAESAAAQAKAGKSNVTTNPKPAAAPKGDSYLSGVGGARSRMAETARKTGESKGILDSAFGRWVSQTDRNFQERQKQKYGKAAGGAAKVRKGMMKGK